MNRDKTSSTSPANVWQLRTRAMHFGPLPAIMGIVNVTPDSFSDGGSFLQTDRAIRHAMQLVEDGAAILDVGGESTRPYAEPVAVEEELRRVVPVLEGLARERVPVPISIDTSKARVAREAIGCGAEIINDVTGLEGDPDMLPLVLEALPGVCVMHMRGTPRTMQDDPRYDDVVAEVMTYLARRRDALVDAGLPLRRICLDPGIGFGKTHEHSLQLMACCSRFHSLGCPLLVGHSRKGFLAKIIGDKRADRTAATIGAAIGLALQQVQVIRVHDVRPLRDALLAFQAACPRDSEESCGSLQA